MTDNSTAPAQLGFGFVDDRPKSSGLPTPEEVRAHLNDILASARLVTADNMWSRVTYRYNKVVFPQMTNWLPDDERAQLCFEFSRELERIELLMAA